MKLSWRYDDTMKFFHDIFEFFYLIISLIDFQNSSLIQIRSVNRYFSNLDEKLLYLVFYAISDRNFWAEFCLKKDTSDKKKRKLPSISLSTFEKSLNILFHFI